MIEQGESLAPIDGRRSLLGVERPRPAPPPRDATMPSGLTPNPEAPATFRCGPLAPTLCQAPVRVLGPTGSGVRLSDPATRIGGGTPNPPDQRGGFDALDGLGALVLDDPDVSLGLRVLGSLMARRVVEPASLENPEGRYCVDCRWFGRSWLAMRFSKCRRPQVADKVSGRQPETFCSVERTFSAGCSPSGFYFEAK